MPKQYNIKWRIEDERELAKVARDFNAKLDRLIRENPKNRNVLPQFYNSEIGKFESRITVDNLKSMIATRADFNRYINMLKRFMRKGAEEIIEAPNNTYGTKTTAWEREELSRLAGIVNRKRRDKLDKLEALEMTDASGELGYNLGERFGMGLASRNQLNPTKAFTTAQSRADIKNKQRALLKEASSTYFDEKDKLLKLNYITALERNYDARDIEDIKRAIEQMDDNLFALKYESRGDEMELAYPEARGSTQYNAYLSELRGYWVGNNTEVNQ